MASPPRTAPPVHPTVLVVGAVLSVQLGSAAATHLFHDAGPGGAAFLRVACGAVILLAVWRPRPQRYGVSGLRLIVLFGLATAAMNFTFYAALDRIPLGIAVALEFTGPLGIAVAGSRRAVDLLWASLAAGGVVLLTPWGGLRLDSIGLLLALLAGLFWATYITLSARVGRRFPGGGALSVALAAGGLALLPVGLRSAGVSLLQPRILAIGIAVALLSAVIPYSLELEALRSLPTRAFGILMSGEPAVAAIIGFIFLRQVLSLRAIIAIALVTVAAVGSSLHVEPTP